MLGFVGRQLTAGWNPAARVAGFVVRSSEVTGLTIGIEDEDDGENDYEKREAHD